MTNRDMVNPQAASGLETQAPATKPLPPMPSPEDAPHPTTDREPIDSPQPNEGDRAPPRPGEIGLSTKR